MINSASMALQQTAKAVGTDRRLAKVTHGGLKIEAIVKEIDLWITFQRSKSAGGLAWRVPLFSAEARVKLLRGEHLLDLEIDGPMGRHIVTIEGDEEEEAFFTLEAKFEPTSDLHLPFLPRDLVAFGPRGAEDRPKGRIEARQRRLNSGFGLSRPIGHTIPTKTRIAACERSLTTAVLDSPSLGATAFSVSAFHPNIGRSGNS